jgi:hypothetical protein
MKKTVLVVFFCGFSILCFARGNFEFYGGLPFNYEEAELAESTMRSFSLGFAGISSVSDFIALGCYDNLIFPQELKATAEGVTVTTNADQYKSILGVDMLLGPVFTLYTQGKIKVPLAVGLHFMMLSSSAEAAASIGYGFGLGVNLGVEFSPIKRIYVFGRVQGTWDFFGSTTVFTSQESVSDSGKLTMLGINPNIGIGFRL